MQCIIGASNLGRSSIALSAVDEVVTIYTFTEKWLVLSFKPALQQVKNSVAAAWTLSLLWHDIMFLLIALLQFFFENTPCNAYGNSK